MNMQKCDRCGKSVEHVHSCSMCAKTVCIACSRLWRGQRFCLDCLSRIYKAPVRQPPKAPEEQPKPTQRIDGATIGILLLTIVVLFIAGSMLTEKLNGYPANDTAVEKPQAPQEAGVKSVKGGVPSTVVEIPANLTLSQVTYMKNIFEFTRQWAECFNGKLEKLNVIAVSRTTDVYIRSVELNGEVVQDWVTSVSGNKIPTGGEGTVTIRVPPALQMEKNSPVAVRILMMGDSGIYQQAKFIPDMSKC